MNEMTRVLMMVKGPSRFRSRFRSQPIYLLTDTLHPRPPARLCCHGSDCHRRLRSYAALCCTA